MLGRRTHWVWALGLVVFAHTFAATSPLSRNPTALVALEQGLSPLNDAADDRRRRRGGLEGEGRAEISQIQPWLIFSMPRSGSRWLVDTVKERSGRTFPSVKEAPLIMKSACEGNDVHLCRSMLREGFDTPCHQEKLKHKHFCQVDAQTAHPGYKFLFYQWQGKGPPRALARAVCDLKVNLVFVWRRNILRRFASSVANKIHAKNKNNLKKKNKKKNKGALAHPQTAEELAAARTLKPHVNTAGLINRIEKDRRLQQNVELAFKELESECEAASKAVSFWYEDLLDGIEGSDARWDHMLEILGQEKTHEFLGEAYSRYHSRKPTISRHSQQPDRSGASPKWHCTRVDAVGLTTMMEGRGGGGGQRVFVRVSDFRSCLMASAPATTVRSK
jgi:hypothetical protein